MEKIIRRALSRNNCTARVTDTVPVAGTASLNKILAMLAICLLSLVSVSCASTPAYPVYPPAVTKAVPADFDRTFRAALVVLREDERVDLHTIDKVGKFVAMEKATGFIFFRHRTILEFVLESAGPNETKITMQLKAEDYEMGGFTHEAGWYPSSSIDTFLGEDVLGLIEQRALQEA